MIKAYILDLNGIFVQSDYLSNRMKEKWNAPIEEVLGALKTIQDIVKLPGAPRTFSLWKPYLERWGIEVDEKDFFDWWFSGEKLQSDVIDFCKEARANGQKVYILSNNFKERTQFYKEAFPEIFGNTDGAYFSCETGLVKPDSEAIKNVIDQNGLKIKEVVYVDDSLLNLESARSVGVRSFASFAEIRDI
ncbi:HAD-IA family hydrolase [bacterium]|nr:HAD-IA family hydrolase [bacterium]